MPLRFRQQNISSETFEAAGVFDVDNDGVLDIVTAGFWYKGPDFRQRFPVAALLPRFRDYYDEFSVIPLDIDGDGHLDFVTGGWWGDSLRWHKNPGKHEFGWGMQNWPVQVIADKIGNVETTRAWDVDGDGELEIVPNTPNHSLCAYKLIRDGAGKGTGKFARHVLYPEKLGHGLGFGDVDGDGRGEFVTPKGIVKAPAAGAFAGPWTFSEEFDLGWDASIPVIVADINGDGLAELLVGGAHSYGLSWYQQSRDASGRRKWAKHPIDPFNAQYHDLQWADIDNDGQPELVTGKRVLAHCGQDAGDYDVPGIYYFKWTGEGFAKQIISADKGCGIQFVLADLRKTGRLDVIAPGKDGLAVFFNEDA